MNLFVKHFIKPDFWHTALSLILPAAAWLGVSATAGALLSSRLPMWAAVPLGLILGALLFAIWLMSQGGASTVVELNVASVILLALLAFFVPVVVKLRHNAQHRHHKIHHPQQPLARPVL